MFLELSRRDLIWPQNLIEGRRTGAADGAVIR